MDRDERADQDWARVLTPEQYEITRCKGTERPFSGDLWDNKRKGTYHCACCGLELFRSDTKYDSGSGWPSFWAAIDEGRIRRVRDDSHGMSRVELTCAGCDAHLGHVFPDGPPPTGERYCTNSASLRFEERG